MAATPRGDARQPIGDPPKGVLAGRGVERVDRPATLEARGGRTARRTMDNDWLVRGGSSSAEGGDLRDGSTLSAPRA